MNTPKVVVRPDHAELSPRVRSATINQCDGCRARVILLAAQGCTRVEIARPTGFSLPVITCWCQHFLALWLDGLLDKPGRGRKAFLPLEAVRRVLEKVTQPRIGVALAAEILAVSVHNSGLPLGIGHNLLPIQTV